MRTDQSHTFIFVFVSGIYSAQSADDRRIVSLYHLM